MESLTRLPFELSQMALAWFCLCFVSAAVCGMWRATR